MMQATEGMDNAFHDYLLGVAGRGFTEKTVQYGIRIFAIDTLECSSRLARNVRIRIV